MPGYSVLPTRLDSALFIPASPEATEDLPSSQASCHFTEQTARPIDALLRDRANHRVAYSLNSTHFLPGCSHPMERASKPLLHRTWSTPLVSQVHIFWLDVGTNKSNEFDRKVYWRHMVLAEKEARDFFTVGAHQAFYEVVPSPDPAAVDSLGRSLLHLAAKSHDSAVLPQILQHLGMFPALPYDLHISVQNDSLLNRATKEKGYTPLHLAVRAQRTHAVDLLLRYRANSSIRDKAGLRPVDCALQFYLNGFNKASNQALLQARDVLEILLNDPKLDINDYRPDRVRPKNSRTLLDQLNENSHSVLYTKLRKKGALHMEEIRKKMLHILQHTKIFSRRTLTPGSDSGLSALTKFSSWHSPGMGSNSSYLQLLPPTT